MIKIRWGVWGSWSSMITLNRLWDLYDWIIPGKYHVARLFNTFWRPFHPHAGTWEPRNLDEIVMMLVTTYSSNPFKDRQLPMKATSWAHPLSSSMLGISLTLPFWESVEPVSAEFICFGYLLMNSSDQKSPLDCVLKEHTSNDRGEPAVSYKWTGWVWGITGWSWRLQENYRSL